MAKQYADIIAFPRATVVPFPIVACGCNRSTCGKIDISRDEWIYSKASEQYYGDLECLAHGIEAYYDAENEAIFFGQWMTVAEFLEEMQAETNINYLPIA